MASRLDRWLLGTLLLVGCTVANPLYRGEGDLGALPTDAGGGDLSGRVPTGPDLLAPQQCQRGERTCSAQSSLQCDATGKFVVDRVCPGGTQCVSGSCTPPPPNGPGTVGDPCSDNGAGSAVICFVNGGGGSGVDCQPFLAPGGSTLDWFCAAAIGSGRTGDTCTEGAECRSGFCGSNGTCFRACSSDRECFNGTQCDSVEITVEGRTFTVDSCIP